MATVTAWDRVFAFDDTEVPYLELYVGFTVAVYLFHTYLDVRQLKVRSPRCVGTSSRNCSSRTVRNPSQVYSFTVSIRHVSCGQP